MKLKATLNILMFLLGIVIGSAVLAQGEGYDAQCPPVGSLWSDSRMSCHQRIMEQLRRRHLAQKGDPRLSEVPYWINDPGGEPRGEATFNGYSPHLGLCGIHVTRYGRDTLVQGSCYKGKHKTLQTKNPHYCSGGSCY
jgi:hypothetical protein